MDFVIYQNIMKYVSTKDLLSFLLLNHEINFHFRDYIYYRFTSDNLKICSLSFLKKEDNGLLNFYPLFQNDLKLFEKIQTIFNILLREPFFCISGGFSTQLYLGQIPKFESDIDIYILGGYPLTLLEDAKSLEDKKELFKKVENKSHIKILIEVYFYIFLEKLRETFGNPTIVKTGKQNSIFSFIFPNFPYTLQFIFTECKTLCDVFSTFDNSHNRCGFYLNDFYVAPDCEISKETKITYFYTETYKIRYKKALNLGFNIFHLSKENQDLFRDYKETKKTNVEVLYNIKNSFISFQEIFESIQIHFIETWKYLYIYSQNLEKADYIEECDLLTYDVYKHTLELNWENDKKLKIKKQVETNIIGLTLKIPVKLFVKLNPINIIINEDYFFKQVHMTHEILKKWKDNQMDIFKKANRWYKIPEKILTTQRAFMNEPNFFEQILKNKDEIIENVLKFNEIEEKVQIEEKIKNIIEKKDGFYKKSIFFYNKLYFYFGYSYQDYLFFENYLPINEQNYIDLNLFYENVKNIKINESIKIYCDFKKKL